MENVYVFAGIPMVMQAMLSSLEGKLKSGPVVRSRSIRAYLGESQISHVLGEIQAQNSSVDIGQAIQRQMCIFSTEFVVVVAQK